LKARAGIEQLAVDWAILDWAFGSSAIGWAVRGVVVGQAASPEGATIALLNLVAGVLFLRRRAPSKVAPLRDCALCLGSVLISGVALKVAPPVGTWPLAVAVCFAVAGAGAIISLVSLGGSFAIFPALREVVERGPFRLVRHPIYACEMVMVCCCSAAAALTVPASAGALGLALLPTLLALALVIVRIRIEEKLLSQSPAYRAYGERVRWRLLPGIW